MKVLIADDHQDFRDAIAWLVDNWDFEPIVATDGQEAWEILRTLHEPVICAFDWMMPNLDGMALTKRIRTELPRLLVYIIIFTAHKTGTEDRVQALEEGGDVYLTKGDVEQSYEILKANFIAGRRTLQEKQDLHRDDITKMWNHRAISEFAQAEIERAKRAETPLSFLIADVDHFKRVNDTFGHFVGNQVLVELAQRISTALRLYDEIGRYERGDEIFIICPDCDELGALSLGERIRNSIADAPIETDQGLVSITVSIGAATLPPGEQLTAKELMERADLALYAGKKEGRNRVNIFRPELTQPKTTP